MTKIKFWLSVIGS